MRRKVLTLVLIAIFFLSNLVFAYAEASYSVLYVEDYDNLKDLTASNARWVAYYLSSLTWPIPWNCDQFEGDGSPYGLAETHDFNTPGRIDRPNARRSDYVYFWGHGYAPLPYPGITTFHAALCLRNWNVSGADDSTTGLGIKDGVLSTAIHGLVDTWNRSYWYGDDSVEENDIEWAHFVSCHALARNGWRYVFNRGLNLILVIAVWPQAIRSRRKSQKNIFGEPQLSLAERRAYGRHISMRIGITESTIGGSMVIFSTAMIGCTVLIPHRVILITRPGSTSVILKSTTGMKPIIPELPIF